MALTLKMPEKQDLRPRITVFGVGGAGGNAVNNMIEKNLEGAEFVYNPLQKIVFYVLQHMGCRRITSYNVCYTKLLRELAICGAKRPGSIGPNYRADREQYASSRNNFV